jgi:TRAP-type mannitol/chloroaromatic compound transport system substrate-binding protein
MKKLFAFSTWLLALSCWVGCSGGQSPEQQAAEAAQSYYQRLLDGYPDGFLAAKAAYDQMPEDYREQLVKANELYMKDMQQKHDGLRSVAISPNVGRTDTALHVVYAFLLLSYGDATQEEVTVPMVLVDGEWKMK